MAHPDKEKLRAYVDGYLDKLSTDDIIEHVEVCEFCGEYCEEYRMLSDSISAAMSMPLPENAVKSANRIYESTFTGKIIMLNLMSVNDNSRGMDYVLAADGNIKSELPIQNIATLFSEDPDIVLQLIRDHNNDSDYLQVISENIDLCSFVMVHALELGKEYITDINGRAAIEDRLSKEYIDSKWQIRLPDSVFDLKALEYDPEKTVSRDMTVIENESGDKIEINLLKKTVGLQLDIRIVEFADGQKYEELRILVSQKGSANVLPISQGKTVSFPLTSPEEIISVRIFA